MSDEVMAEQNSRAATKGTETLAKGRHRARHAEPVPVGKTLMTFKRGRKGKTSGNESRTKAVV